MLEIKLVHNRKKLLKKNGTALIQWQLKYAGRYKHVSTKINVAPDQFDPDKEEVTAKHHKARLLNRVLRDQRDKIEDLEYQIIQGGGKIRLSLFEGVLEGKKVSRMNFIDFCIHELEVEDIKASTKKEQMVFVNKLKAYDPHVTFADIDVTFCQGFHSFLKRKGLGINTIGKEFKNFRKFVNRAIDKDFMDINQYPFRNFKIGSAPTKKLYLTQEELTLFESVDLEDFDDLQLSQDLYLFSCYTGLRFSDVTALTSGNLVQREREWYLELRMQKTNTDVVIPVGELFDGKGLAILRRYRSMNRETLFPGITNQYANRCLKVIGKMAGIKKNITFHSSRHTFGTVLLNKGLPKESVQALMGHSSLYQTEQYVQMLGTTIVNQLRSLRVA